MGSECEQHRWTEEKVKDERASRQREERPDGWVESQDDSEKRQKEDSGIKARDVEGE